MTRLLALLATVLHALAKLGGRPAGDEPEAKQDELPALFRTIATKRADLGQPSLFTEEPAAADSPRRAFRPRRLVGLLVATVAVAAIVSGAFAYFTSSGSGTAAASTGNLNAPTDVVATATAGSGTVPISWTASSTSGSAVAPQGYYVVRVKNSDSSTAAACGTPTSLITGTSCSDLSVPDGTYHYVVAAVFNSWTAESASSNDVTVVSDSTAPTTSIAFPGSGYYNASSYNGGCSPAGICGMASDPSGVAVVRVSVQRNSDGFYWNGASFVNSAESFNSASLDSPNATSTNWNLALPLPNDGGYTVHVQAKDTVGNDSAPASTSTGTFSIDTTAPATSLATTPAAADGSNGWFQRASVSFTLSATDGGSDVASRFYTIDGGSSQTYSTAVNITSQGDHTVTYWSVDNVGNIESTHTTHIKLDNVAPSTTIAITPSAPDGSNGWRVSATSFTLAATDGTSGVATTKYQIDGGTVTSYSGSAVSLPEGSHTVSYWSVDSAGNAESPNTTATIKVDSVKPSTGFAISPTSPSGSNGWYKTAAPTVTLTRSDATSGVATTTYEINGGPTQTYTVPVTLPDGSDVVTYRSTDNAGNVESTHTSATFKVDTVPPSTGFAISPVSPNGSTGWYKTTAPTVTLTPTDAGSGVATTTYEINGGTPQTYTVPVTLPDGNDVVTYWSSDSAGNVEATNTSTTFKVDTVKPTMPTNAFSAFTNASANGSTVYYRPGATSGSFTVTGSSTDAGSGVASYSFPTLPTGWTSTPGGLGVNSYSWSAPTPTVPSANQTVTATDNAGNTSTGTATNNPFTVVADSTAPTGGALTVAGGVATSGGATVQLNNSTSFTIGARTNYTETQNTTQSGLASSILTVQSESLSGSTCGALGSGGPFTSATPIAGTTQPSGIVAGACYVYTLTGTDNVGNTVSITTTVVDNAVSFSVTTQPSSVTAGTATSATAVKITAIKNGQTDTTYTGTLAWSGANNSPSGATPTLPTSPTWTSGVATFGITLVKAESETLSATDGTRTANFTAITVNPAAATKMVFVNCSLPTSNATCSGQPISVGNQSDMTFNIQTQDTFGNPSAPTASISITFTNSDGTFTIASGAPASITTASPTSGQVDLHHGNNGGTDTLTAIASSGFANATLTAKK